MNSRLDLAEEGSVNRNWGPQGQGGAGYAGGLVAPKLAKLDFPCYDGLEDPTLWICRAEQFFEFQGTSLENQVKLAAYHLENDAQLWFQQRKNQGHLVTWDGLKAGLLAKFAATEYEDSFGDLCKLKQTGTVSDYQPQFERLLARAGSLTDKQEAACFISGLKDGLRADVRAQNPQNLSAAIGLARNYELKAQEIRRSVNPTFSSSVRNSSNQWNNSLTPSGSKTINLEMIFPIRNLTPIELQRRREQELCYSCDENYTVGHKCKKLFFIEIDEEGEEATGEMYTEETPVISLHALAGIQTPHTMRVHSQISKIPLTILIDSGSTHNYLHHRFAKITRIKPERSCLFSVVVANGERLSSPGRCKGVRLTLQDVPIEVDFFLLPLEGCDDVLGVQWLCILGPILWDFGRMQMQFAINGRQVMLQGSTTVGLQAFEGDTILRTLRQSDDRGIILQLWAIQQEQRIHEESITDGIGPLLSEFSDLFQSPTGLPPPRPHDHRIPLQPGARPICLRPYRYWHFQKQ